ncbi:hypothetical protein CDIK_0281 [Cucumispora dikerogammari]|nr:hypothetical protein CDIK_0281 [Cucumispora dikerogammari]
MKDTNTTENTNTNLTMKAVELSSSQELTPPQEDKELTNILLDPFSYFIQNALTSLKSPEIPNNVKVEIIFYILDNIISKKVSNQSLLKNIPELYFLFAEDKTLYRAFVTLMGDLAFNNPEIQNFLSTEEFYGLLDFNEDITYYLIKNICVNNSETRKFFVEIVYKSTSSFKSIETIFETAQ